MKLLKAIIKPLVPRSIRARYGRNREFELYLSYAFSHRDSAAVARELERKYGDCGDLLQIFASNRDFFVNKWHHYIPLYERYFSPYRGRKLRFLEIGVSEGGSLQMWRRYFGNDAVIFGIDIDPACARFNGRAGQVRIGSQTDERFLASVVAEMGGIDVVLDDGSHHMDHVAATLKILFPHLGDGGIYMIEDLHTAYWKGHGGGHRARKNFFRFLMELVDDMHHWYHRAGQKQPSISDRCTGIHIHDSIVVLEKNPVHQPAHSRIG